LTGSEPQAGDPVRRTVSIRRVAWILAIVIAALSLTSFVAEVVATFVVVGNKYVDRIAEWLEVDREASLPTWYAVITLMACAVLLAVIARDAFQRGRPFPRHWAALAVIFALLSLEEIIGIHSEATQRLRALVSITEGFGYAIALGAIALVGLGLVALLFGRFYLHLPVRWRMWFTIGAVIYLIGVFASDAVGDYLITASGAPTLAYVVVQTVEEAFEMAGVLIFIVMLLDYIRTFVGRVSFEVTDPVGG
jgi:hypothetical protein